MRTARTITKNSIWLLSGEIAGKAIVFLIMLIIARRLGVENFGKFTLAQSIVMIFAVISDLGLNIFLFREIPQNKRSVTNYVGNIFLIRVALSLLFFGALILFLKLVNYEQEIKEVTYILGLWLCFTNLTYVFRTVFKALEIMVWDAIINILDTFFRLIFILVFFFWGITLFKVAFAYMASAFIACCLGFYIFYQKNNLRDFKIDLSIWKEFSKEMGSLALVAILIPIFGKFDSVVLAHFRGNEAVGYYNAAAKIVWMLLLVPGMFTQAAFPKLSQFSVNDQSKFRALVSYLLKGNLFITGMICLMLFFWAKPVLILIYGKEYLAAVSVFQILVWALLFHGLNGVFIYSLNARKKQTVNVVMILTTITINVSCAILLAPDFGYLGVAFSTVGSLLFMFVGYFVYFLKHRYVSISKLRFSIADYWLLKQVVNPKGDYE